MDIVDLGTPLGLAFASGLNAYLPLLAFALSARWLHLHALNQQFMFITQNWCIAALAILAIVDFVADKIPLIDHAWNAIHTVVRPIAGAFVAVAASGHAPPAAAYDASSIIPVTEVGLLALLIVGTALAILSHRTKSTVRFASTIISAGLFNSTVSLIEDALVLIIILLSLFASAIMLLLLVILVLILLPRFLRTRNIW